MDKVADAPLDFFDYRAALREWNVSYLVVRDSESLGRILLDPHFDLVFKNSDSSIFKVKSS